jgi:uncharacterized protein
MKTFVKRLHHGQDLLEEIRTICEERGIKAGIILSAVGSLSKTNLRAPVIEGKIKYIQPTNLEIVSVTGTVSINGYHVHLSGSDMEGKVWGGHIKEGCIVRTTCELVIGVLEDTQFMRKADPATGYDELYISEY